MLVLGTQFMMPYHSMVPVQHGAMKYPAAGTEVSTANKGPCFGCSMVGHFRMNCPRLSSGKGRGAMNKYTLLKFYCTYTLHGH